MPSKQIEELTYQATARDAGGLPVPALLLGKLQETVRFEEYYRSTNGSAASRMAVNNAILAAASIGSSAGRKITVTTPPDELEFDAPIVMKSNVTLHNRAHLKYTGAAQGHFVFWQGTENTEFFGGEIDCNSIGNTNGLALGGDNTGAFVNYGANIHDVVVRNCRKSAEASIGEGGGKAFNAEHGISGLRLSGVRVEDSDFGICYEGTSTSLAQDIQFSDLTSLRCTYAGALLRGTTNDGGNNSLIYRRSNALITNMLLVDCAEDQSDFAPLTFNMATGVVARAVQIHNSSGRVNITKGATRFCDIEVQAKVNSLRSGIDCTPWGGILPSPGEMRHSKIKASILIESTGATGYLLDAASATKPQSSSFEIEYLQWDGTDYLSSEFDGIGKNNAANFEASCDYIIRNRSTNTVYTGAGNVAA